MGQEFNATKRSDLYQIDPKAIIVREGFNCRQNFNIDELAKSIAQYGVMNPVTVRKVEVDGVERYELVDGERRYRATLQAIEQGADIVRIPALIVSKSLTEEDLLIQQFTRNGGEGFNDYETALGYKRFIDFGHTQTEIAEKLKVKPAYVSKCLSLLELAPSVQEALRANQISTSAALEIVDATTTSVDAAKAVETAVETAKKAGKTKATSKHVDTAEVIEKRQIKSMVNGFLTFFEVLEKCGVIELANFDPVVFVGNLQDGMSINEAVAQLSGIATPQEQAEERTYTDEL